MAKVLGYMYIAKAPCGCVTAMAWDDPEKSAKKSTANLVARCIKRGDNIKRVRRLDTDPMPTLYCKKHTKETNGKQSGD